MNWRYHVLGGHTHVRVYVNGSLCGHLVFRNEEFADIKREHFGHGKIAFLDDIDESHKRADQPLTYPER